MRSFAVLPARKISSLDLSPQECPRLGEKIGVGVALRAVFFVFPASFLLKRMQYGRTNVLSYPFCLHQDILKVARSDRRMSSIYGLLVVFTSVAIDSVLLMVSYIMILKTVLSIASKTERLRTLNTCVSHICAVITFYTPLIGLSMIRRYGKNAPPVVHILMANACLLVPPLMNPIVYSVKTKQIRTRIVKKFWKDKGSKEVS
ncbi:UNVERIFIED_CONTAM: hypothetical protein K2H54_073634 [Gekko kuhli]